MAAEPVKLTSTQEIAERQIETFAQHYGAEALAFACHAAFPMTLTTDLVYCLRQEFFGDADWAIAPTMLLSDLCDGWGNDLYEIPMATRYCLLDQLLRHEDYGETRLYQIERFMKQYIHYRLVRHRDTSAKFHGHPPEWISLAMLRRDEDLTELIETQIAEYFREGTLSQSDRLWLVSMIRGQIDLFSERQLEPIMLQKLAGRVRQGDRIEAPDHLTHFRDAMARAGFPELKTAEIEYAKISFAAPAQPEGTLQPFSFETVTVDLQGREISKSPHTAYAYIETLPAGLNLAMVAIPSGKFMMGSSKLEHDRYDDEGPQHEVTVSPFFIGKYAVTQAQWRLVAGLPPVERELEADPAEFKGDDRPVEQVSWQDATEFCKRLWVATGREYRLPSEAEWEYACRAGTTTPFYFGETITGKLANYNSDVIYRQEKNVKHRQETTPVGSFPPNPFGLYDMHGNVYEWCLDHWHGNYEADSVPKDGSAWLDENAETNTQAVLRGGSWTDDPRLCRSAFRVNFNLDFAFNTFGFRVVCCAPRTLA